MNSVGGSQTFRANTDFSVSARFWGDDGMPMKPRTVRIESRRLHWTLLASSSGQRLPDEELKNDRLLYIL
jgi:hypothetical protein